MDEDDGAVALPYLKVEQDDEDGVDDDAPGAGQTGPEIEASACGACEQTHADLDTQIPGNAKEGGCCHGGGQRGDVVRGQRIVVDFKGHSSDQGERDAWCCI